MPSVEPLSTTMMLFRGVVWVRRALIVRCNSCRRLKVTTTAGTFMGGLVYVVYFSGLIAAIFLHQSEAFVCIEMAYFCVFFGDESVHVRCGWQSFQVFASLFEVYRSEVHAVDVDNFYVYARGCFFEKDVCSSVV